jgi:hypothetical protein
MATVKDAISAYEELVEFPLEEPPLLLPSIMLELLLSSLSGSSDEHAVISVITIDNVKKKFFLIFITFYAFIF